MPCSLYDDFDLRLKKTIQRRNTPDFFHNKKKRPEPPLVTPPLSFTRHVKSLVMIHPSTPFGPRIKTMYCGKSMRLPRGAGSLWKKRGRLGKQGSRHTRACLLRRGGWQNWRKLLGLANLLGFRILKLGSCKFKMSIWEIEIEKSNFYFMDFKYSQYLSCLVFYIPEIHSLIKLSRQIK